MSDVFGAIADPTRREILQLLRDGEMTVSDIAGEFDVSRPAISQHLRILLEADLVDARTEGRNRYYYVVPDRLSEVIDWVSYFDAFWTSKLQSLGNFLGKKK